LPNQKTINFLSIFLNLNLFSYNNNNHFPINFIHLFIFLEMGLQYLLLLGLKMIPQVVFSYVLEKWRWSVFRGDIKESEFNAAWWYMRSNLQGISTISNQQEHDFDPASKYHIVENMPYAR